MTTKDLLLAARTRIAKKEHWTKGAYARDANWREVITYSPDAVCWCAVGAMHAERPSARTVQAAKEAIARIGGGLVHQLNDRSTHAEILALFDAAIDAESQRS